MKITEKQLLMLFEIAKYSIEFKGVFAGFKEQTRLDLINDIINQQGDELIDVKSE